MSPTRVLRKGAIANQGSSSCWPTPGITIERACGINASVADSPPFFFLFFFFYLARRCLAPSQCHPPPVDNRPRPGRRAHARRTDSFPGWSVTCFPFPPHPPVLVHHSCTPVCLSASLSSTFFRRSSRLLSRGWAAKVHVLARTEVVLEQMAPRLWQLALERLKKRAVRRDSLCICTWCCELQFILSVLTVGLACLQNQLKTKMKCSLP